MIKPNVTELIKYRLVKNFITVTCNVVPIAWYLVKYCSFSVPRTLWLPVNAVFRIDISAKLLHLKSMSTY